MRKNYQISQEKESSNHNLKEKLDTGLGLSFNFSKNKEVQTELHFNRNDYLDSQELDKISKFYDYATHSRNNQPNSISAVTVSNTTPYHGTVTLLRSGDSKKTRQKPPKVPSFGWSEKLNSTFYNERNPQVLIQKLRKNDGRYKNEEEISIPSILDEKNTSSKFKFSYLSKKRSHARIHSELVHNHSRSKSSHHHTTYHKVHFNFNNLGKNLRK